MIFTAKWADFARFGGRPNSPGYRGTADVSRFGRGLYGILPIENFQSLKAEYFNLKN